MDQAGATAPETTGRRLGAAVRGIRTARGMTLTELGRLTGYSAAQVSRFERGIAPLTDISVLHRFAAALGIAPQTFGLTASHLGTGPAGDGEQVKPYADRGLVTRHQWNSLIGDASAELWLYGMAEFGYASDDAVPGILARAARRGCQIRILLLNPQSPLTEVIDRDESHPPGTLTTRVA